MTVGVSHTFGGNVVVVDMESGRRWDMTPEMAMDAAEKFTAAAGYMTASALVVVDCLEGRKFRWAGDRPDALKMARDLTEHAIQATEGTVAGPDDDGPRAA